MSANPPSARFAGRVFYVVGFLALSVLYYEFLGAAPTPSERPETIAWWRPAGWALELESPVLEPLQDIAADVVQARHEGTSEPRAGIPVAVFALPPVLMTVVGFALFRAAPARVLVLAVGLLLCAFSYYGWLDQQTWQDYSWRWPAALAVTSIYVASFLLGPALVAWVRSRSPAMRAFAAIALFVSVYFLSTEVTGTNPQLEWNLSPWPVVTLYGFLLCGLILATVHLAAALGLWVRSTRAGAVGVALGAASAAVVALLLREVPFSDTTLARSLVLMIPAALLAALFGRSSTATQHARQFALAGVLILAAIKLGQWQAESFQTDARDQISPIVIDAIEAYREDKGWYPDELDDLVPDYLDELPQPQVGWVASAEERFNYIDLGDSFLLEFPSVLWVQCAYNPAYVEELDEEGEGLGTAGTDVASATPGTVEVLPASWSCESRPPRLW